MTHAFPFTPPGRTGSSPSCKRQGACGRFASWGSAGWGPGPRAPSPVLVSRKRTALGHGQRTPRGSAGAVSRSERAGRPECGGRWPGSGQGGLRGGVSTKPRATCWQQRSGFRTCLIRKWVCSESGGGTGSEGPQLGAWPVGGVPRSPTRPGAPSQGREGRVGGSAGSGRPWPCLVRTPAWRHWQRPQLGEVVGAGNPPTHPSRAPPSNREKRWLILFQKPVKAKAEAPSWGRISKTVSTTAHPPAQAGPGPHPRPPLRWKVRRVFHLAGTDVTPLKQTNEQTWGQPLSPWRKGHGRSGARSSPPGERAEGRGPCPAPRVRGVGSRRRAAGPGRAQARPALQPAAWRRQQAAPAGRAAKTTRSWAQLKTQQEELAPSKGRGGSARFPGRERESAGREDWVGSQLLSTEKVWFPVREGGESSASGVSSKAGAPPGRGGAWAGRGTQAGRSHGWDSGRGLARRWAGPRAEGKWAWSGAGWAEPRVGSGRGVARGWAGPSGAPRGSAHRSEDGASAGPPATAASAGS